MRQQDEVQNKFKSGRGDDSEEHKQSTADEVPLHGIYQKLRRHHSHLHQQPHERNHRDLTDHTKDSSLSLVDSVDPQSVIKTLYESSSWFSTKAKSEEFSSPGLIL